MAQPRNQAKSEREKGIREETATLVRLRLAAIVESSDDAIIEKDVNGMVTYWNNGAERLYGYSADEVIGKSISLLLSLDRPDDFAEIMKKIRGREVVRHFETVHQRKGGTRINVSLAISPIRDSQGQIVGGLTIARDISERRRAEEVLREKNKELSEAWRMAAAGRWRWDARNDEVTWSEELYQIAGLDPTLPAPSYREHPRLFTAESWERLQRAVGEVLRDGRAYELDLEMVRPDGTTRWVRQRGEVADNTPGHFLRLRGTTQDITERKLAEEPFSSMNRKLLMAQEQERKRVARELHDDINQRLGLLAMTIEQLKNTIPRNIADVQVCLNDIYRQTLEISTTVQTLSHDLHSSRLEYLGLALSMKAFCREFGDKHKVEVAFAADGVPASLAAEIALCLFRVMQEGLQNALKHSGVKSFEVKVQGSPAEIHLTVRDPGAGFDPEWIKGTQGIGLISMKERVRLVNGMILITSRPQFGTEINVCVPVKKGTP